MAHVALHMIPLNLLAGDPFGTQGTSEIGQND